MMEYKIGERFIYNNYLVECIDDHYSCQNCIFQFGKGIDCSIIHHCAPQSRQDGKSVKFIKRDIMNKPEIKAGMLVTYNNDNYLLIPDRRGCLVGISNNDRWVSNIKDLNLENKLSKIGWPDWYNGLRKWVYGEVLWEKPQELVLTMQEIADKFGIPVEQLKIKK